MTIDPNTAAEATDSDTIILPGAEFRRILAEHDRLRLVIERLRRELSDHEGMMVDVE